VVGKLRVGNDGFADIGIDGMIVRLQVVSICLSKRSSVRERVQGDKARTGGVRGKSGEGVGGEARARSDEDLVRYKRPREKPHGDRRRLFERGHLRVSGVIRTSPRDGSRVMPWRLERATDVGSRCTITNACVFSYC